MNEVTQLLDALSQGDERASSQLLPLVYEDLRRLARQRLAQEKPGQTLDATALVHEAYLRLVGSDDPQWDGRRHFFAAAAEAMRRILVENARRKGRQRHGGGRQRVEGADPIDPSRPDELLLIDEALERLGEEDSQAAELVKLRYFAGFSVEDAGDLLGLSRATAYRHWAYARAWLLCEIEGSSPPPS